MFLLNGVKFNPNQPFVIDEIQYSPRWFKDASVEEREALGITEVPDPIRPDDRYFFVQENADGSYSTTPRDIAPVKDQYKRDIDIECGNIRNSFVSPGLMVEEEYRRAYEDALTYKNGGYNGVVPQSVQTWAEVKNKSAQWAAEDIIITRNMYAFILDSVRDLRLRWKAFIDQANTPEALESTMNSAKNALNSLKAQLPQ